MIATVAALAGLAGPRAAAAEIRDAVAATDVQVYGRLDAVYDDNGLYAEDGYTPTKTTDIYERDLKLALAAKPTAATSFHLVIGPLAESVVELATATYRANDQLSIRAGQDYVLAGGWEQKTWDYSTLLVSPYVQALMPWVTAKDPSTRTGPASAPAVAASATAPGLLTATLQVLDDVVVGDSAAANFSHSHRQPAVLLELTGDSTESGAGPGSGTSFKPLFQIGAYDLNHSLTSALGLQVTSGAWTLHTDLLLDLRQQPVATHAARSVTQYRTVDLDAAYDAARFQLFGTALAMDVLQPTTGGNPDHRGNLPGLGFDDNAFDFALGARYRLDGDVFKPFVAVVRKSGRFLVSAGDVGGPVQTKADLAVDVGVTTAF